MKTCPICHEVLPDDARFCPIDGTSLAAVESDPLLGSVIADRYLLLERLGQGSSGSIYRAEHTLLHQPLAVKLIHAHLSQNEAVVARFRQEASSIAMLKSEHIVKYTDFGRTPDGRFFLIMEFLKGETLATRLGSEGRFAEERAVKVLEQIGDALAEAHAQGYVHRDIRPRNILLTTKAGETEWVKLLDFGLSKLVEPRRGSQAPAVGSSIGDPRYMSPEQASGEVIDQRSDIYSLAILAYELVTGAPPFTGAGTFDILTKHREAEPVPIQDRAPAISAPYSNAVAVALSKKSRDRYPTVTRFINALTGKAPVELRSESRASMPSSPSAAAIRKDTVDPVARLKAAEEAARKRAADEAAKRKAADEAAKKKAADEAAKKKAADEAAKKMTADEAAQKRAAEDAAAKRAAADEDAKKIKAIPDDAEKAKLAEEAAKKLATDEDSRKGAANEIPRKAPGDGADIPLVKTASSPAIKLKAGIGPKGAVGPAVPAAKLPNVPLAREPLAASPPPVPDENEDDIAALKKATDEAVALKRSKDEAAAPIRTAPKVGPTGSTPGAEPAGRRVEEPSAPRVPEARRAPSVPAAVPGKKASLVVVPPEESAKAIRAPVPPSELAIEPAPPPIEAAPPPVKPASAPPAQEPQRTPGTRTPGSPSESGVWFAEGLAAEKQLTKLTRSGPLPPMYDEIEEEEEAKSRNRPVIIIGGVVAIAAVLLFVLIYLGGSKEEKKPSQGTARAPLLLDKGAPPAPEASVVASSSPEAGPGPDATAASTPGPEAGPALASGETASPPSTGPGAEPAPASPSETPPSPSPAKEEPAVAAPKPEPPVAAAKPEPPAPVAPKPVPPVAAAKPRPSPAAVKPTPIAVAAKKPAAAKPAVHKPPKPTPAPAHAAEPPTDKKDPQQARVHVQAGRAALSRGATSEANEEFKLALGVDPRSAEAHAGLGEVAFELGNHDAAASALQKAIKLNGKNVQYHVLLGHVYFKQGQYQKSVDSYNKALKLSPNHAAAQRGLDAANRRLGDGQQP